MKHASTNFDEHESSPSRIMEDHNQSEGKGEKEAGALSLDAEGETQMMPGEQSQVIDFIPPLI